MEIVALVISVLASSLAIYSIYITHPKKVKSIYPDQPPYYINRFTGERIGKHYNPKE